VHAVIEDEPALCCLERRGTETDLARIPPGSVARFELLTPGIARHGYPVLLGENESEPAGHVTSGTRLPSLGKSMGMAYLRPRRRRSG
jgi:glycine cleavage system aminomethyltransferase T